MPLIYLALALSLSLCILQSLWKKTRCSTVLVCKYELAVLRGCVYTRGITVPPRKLLLTNYLGREGCVATRCRRFSQTKL
jgi:hypothetical protein